VRSLRLPLACGVFLTWPAFSALAFSTLLLALGLVTGHIITNGAESFTFLYDHYTGLISASLLMAIVQGIYVFARSYDGAEGKLLSLVGNSGSFFYDVRRCSFST
jgi:delta14-sterol reductase